ncbi:putative methionyl-tRNA synthetase [Hordeum vulgare]|nr:putative methionyl-tRNA synthetase [Hordeum vulgare]
MDEIITSGSIAGASFPGFGVQDEIMESAGDIDDEIDDVEEEGEEEEQAEVESKPVPKRRGEKKRASKAKLVESRTKWTSKEDECHAEAWKTVSIDPITGTN